MSAILRFAGRIHVGLFIVVLLIIHSVLYFALGTPSWFFTALIATGTWTAALLILRGVHKMMNRERGQS